MNARKVIADLGMAAMVLPGAVYFVPPPAFSAGCAPVVARNDYERTIMEASSDKQGCWVRGDDGQLYFLSDLAPDKGYKPLIPQSARTQPPPSKSAARALPHGPNNPSLHGLVAGTWNSTFCGLETGSLNLTSNGQAMHASVTGRSVAMNQECDSAKGDICYQPPAPTLTCSFLEPHLVGSPKSSDFSDVGFDGQVLWIGSVSAGREIQFTFSGGTLTLVGDPRQPPTVYRKR
jgi:hypothetical protein